MARTKKTKSRRRRRPKVTELLSPKNRAKLRYVDTVTLNPAVASINNYRFRCNGLNDPDFETGGHAPLLFNEYEGLYDTYRVLSSKVVVTPVATAASNVTPCIWGVYTDSDSVLGYSTATSAIEDIQRTKRWRIHTGFTSSTDAQVIPRNGRLTAGFNAKMLSPEARYNGIPVGSDPATGGNLDAYYHIWAASIAGNDPSQVTFLVEIEYLVEFTDPKQVTPST